MYHSWTTFALLMWALILWMVPNKRASMMKCSPFIVFYATVLLLIQYIYSMNLTSDELPDTIHGITIAEIGFSKPDQLSCWHLMVKVCKNPVLKIYQFQAWYFSTICYFFRTEVTFASFLKVIKFIYFNYLFF